MASAADNVSGKPVSTASRRRFPPLALAALSLVIYGCTIFSLPQVRNERFCCEQSSVAAAVSNVMYRTRLGALYSGVFDYFIAHFEEPLEQTLQEAQMPVGGLPTKPPGALYKTTRDGNGVGYPVIATVAFRLFGMHTGALTLTMLMLMALSASLFLLRFTGARYPTVVILYFTALTVMLFTPLVWDPSYIVQIPVAGIRYFSLVSVLPIFHILFELMDPNAAKGGARRRVALLLGLQTAILVLVMLVRGSALTLFGAIGLVICVLAWRWQHERSLFRALLGNAAVIGVASACTLAAIAVSVSHEYLTQGRFGTVIWHRVVESLGLNPAFPFPGVNDMFDCKKYVPEGIQPGTPDTNGHCMWFDYVTKHQIPIGTIGDKTYGSLYETAMRQAFFKLVAQFPVEALKTFIYYKARYIVWSIAQSMRFNFSGDQTMAVPGEARTGPYSPLAIGLLLFSLGIAFVYFCLAKIALKDLWAVTRVTLLAALFTLPSYVAVWAMPHTSADLLLYCVFTTCLAVGAVISAIKWTLARSCASGDVIPPKTA